MEPILSGSGERSKDPALNTLLPTCQNNVDYYTRSGCLITTNHNTQLAPRASNQQTFPWSRDANCPIRGQYVKAGYFTENVYILTRPAPVRVNNVFHMQTTAGRLMAGNAKYRLDNLLNCPCWIARDEYTLFDPSFSREFHFLTRGMQFHCKKFANLRFSNANGISTMYS